MHSGIYVKLTGREEGKKGRILKPLPRWPWGKYRVAVLDDVGDPTDIIRYLRRWEFRIIPAGQKWDPRRRSHR